MSNPRELLDQLRNIIRQRYCDYRMEQAFVTQARQFIRFHNYRDPAALTEDDIAAWLSHLAHTQHQPAHVVRQARRAIRFLYEEVLDRPLTSLPRFVGQRQQLSLPGLFQPTALAS